MLGDKQRREGDGMDLTPKMVVIVCFSIKSSQIYAMRAWD